MTSTQDDIERAVANARDEDEVRLYGGDKLARQPCHFHCTVCEGQDHHWLPDCDEAGEPLMVCKHCPAWREMRDDDELG